MTHFLFHLHDHGVVTQDEEGRDLPDLQTARRYANAAARGIICAEVEGGEIYLGSHIEIENGETGERHVVEFRDVVRITGA